MTISYDLFKNYILIFVDYNRLRLSPLLKRQLKMRRRPVSIAVFGQTGVGKSSLLNALFDLTLETSDSEPCTKEPMYVDLYSNSQTLRFIDIPGWGEQQIIDDGRKNEWQKLDFLSGYYLTSHSFNITVCRL